VGNLPHRAQIFVKNHLDIYIKKYPENVGTMGLIGTRTFGKNYFYLPEKSVFRSLKYEYAQVLPAYFSLRRWR
jgi:hypothetical protein